MCGAFNNINLRFISYSLPHIPSLLPCLPPYVPFSYSFPVCPSLPPSQLLSCSSLISFLYQYFFVHFFSLVSECRAPCVPWFCLLVIKSVCLLLCLVHFRILVSISLHACLPLSLSLYLPLSLSLPLSPSLSLSLSAYWTMHTNAKGKKLHRNQRNIEHRPLISE